MNLGDFTMMILEFTIMVFLLCHWRLVAAIHGCMMLRYWCGLDLQWFEHLLCDIAGYGIFGRHGCMILYNWCGFLIFKKCILWILVVPCAVWDIWYIIYVTGTDLFWVITSKQVELLLVMWKLLHLSQNLDMIQFMMNKLNKLAFIWCIFFKQETGPVSIYFFLCGLSATTWEICCGVLKMFQGTKSELVWIRLA